MSSEPYRKPASAYLKRYKARTVFVSLLFAASYGYLLELVDKGIPRFKLDTIELPLPKLNHANDY